MGRPLSGMTLFDDRTLAALPEDGTVAEVSRVLGVTATTIRTWLKKGAPFTRRGMTYVIHKKSFVNWLVKTAHGYDSPVLDHTQQVGLLGPEAKEFLKAWANSVSLPSVFTAEFLKVLEAERKRF